MIRDFFRVLVVDLCTGRGNVATMEGRNTMPAAAGLPPSCSTNMAIPIDHGMIPINPSSSPSVRLPVTSR